MKALPITLLSLVVGTLHGAQTATPGSGKIFPDKLVQTRVQFKAIGQPLAISSEDAFVGYPFCSSDGTTFWDAVLHPDFAEYTLLGVSPKGDLSKYRIGAPGILNPAVLSVDAVASEPYAFVSAQKTDPLREHGLGSSDSKATSPNYQYFVLDLSRDLSASSEVALDLPFPPLRFAAMAKIVSSFLVLIASIRRR